MSKLKVTTIANAADTESVNVTNVVNGTAKAWINFNGHTNTIRESFNVSSITDNAQGEHTINFTNAMVDANYAVSITGSFVGGDQGGSDTSYDLSMVGTFLSTTSVEVNFRNYGTGGLYDNMYSSVIVFR